MHHSTQGHFTSISPTQVQIQFQWTRFSFLTRGGTPRNFTHFYSGSEYLFPGETVMGSALVSGTPTRAYVASHGVGFGAVIQ